MDVARHAGLILLHVIPPRVLAQQRAVERAARGEVERQWQQSVGPVAVDRAARDEANVGDSERERGAVEPVRDVFEDDELQVV